MTDRFSALWAACRFVDEKHAGHYEEILREILENKGAPLEWPEIANRVRDMAAEERARCASNSSLREIEYGEARAVLFLLHLRREWNEDGERAAVRYLQRFNEYYAHAEPVERLAWAASATYDFPLMPALPLLELLPGKQWSLDPCRESDSACTTAHGGHPTVRALHECLGGVAPQAGHFDLTGNGIASSETNQNQYSPGALAAALGRYLHMVLVPLARYLAEQESPEVELAQQYLEHCLAMGRMYAFMERFLAHARCPMDAEEADAADVSALAAETGDAIDASFRAWLGQAGWRDNRISAHFIAHAAPVARRLARFERAIWGNGTGR